MKKLVFAFIAVMSIYSCEQHEKPNQETLFGKDVAKQKGDVFPETRVKTANPSVMHFNEAIASFEKGDMATTATHIKAGADALANEGKFEKGEDRQHLNSIILKLEQLAVKVNKGETKKIDDLMEAFAAAQVAVVQDYIVDFDEYLRKIPEPSSYYPHFKAAIQAVENTVPYLSANVKEEAKLLVKRSNELLETMDEGKPVSEEQIRKDRASLEQFLQSHRLAQK
ncbi:MAG: hypothetical protein R2828_07780 [Saprospiraceae bacterium]